MSSSAGGGSANDEREIRAVCVSGKLTDHAVVLFRVFDGKQELTTTRTRAKSNCSHAVQPMPIQWLHQTDRPLATFGPSPSLHYIRRHGIECEYYCSSTHQCWAAFREGRSHWRSPYNGGSHYTTATKGSECTDTGSVGAVARCFAEVQPMLPLVWVHVVGCSQMQQVAMLPRDRLADEKVKVVIVTGAGRAFSAGVDLTDAQSSRFACMRRFVAIMYVVNGLWWHRSMSLVFQGAVQEIKDPLSVLESYPGVTIAAVNGHAITGGFELALGCDILVASTAAQFRDTHCKFGIFPSWGLSQKLSRAIGSSRARVAHFTGQPIHAGTALEWGLVAEVVEPEQLLPRSIQVRCRAVPRKHSHPRSQLYMNNSPSSLCSLGVAAKQLAQSIAKAHPRLLVAMNQVIRDGLGKPLEEARELERQRALQYYDTMTAEDFAAMQSFIAGRRKQKPQGVGKQRTSASSAVLHQSKL